MLGRPPNILGSGGWWLGAAHRLDGVSPLAILSPASGKSMLGGRSANDNELISRQGGIKYVIGPDGSLQTVPANTLAYDWSDGIRELLFEGASTNGLRNSSGAGAASGSPGTLPTLWNTYNGGGLTRTVTAGVTDKGFPCLDVRLSGVTTEGSWTIFFDATTAPATAAVQGETVTESLFLALVGGSLANLSQVYLNIYERDTAGTGITGSTGPNIRDAVGSSLKRYTATRTMERSDCAYAHTRLVFTWAIGATVDFTIRIALPQWEKASAASSPIPTSGAVATRATDIATLWAGASAATAWAYRAVVPVVISNQFLLRSAGGSFLRASSVTPADIFLDGLGGDALRCGTGVLPGNIGAVVGWGPSGRRACSNGGAANGSTSLVTYATTNMQLGQSSSGLSAGQIIRVRELVAWQLADRPSADGALAQAKAWSA